MSGIKSVRALNYFEHVLILVSAISDCSSISAFALLVRVAAGIASSTIGIKICAITGGINKYKSSIKKREKSTIK